MRDMTHYEANLRHVVRPDERDARKEAPSVVLRDYEALFLARALREYAAYNAPRDSTEEAVALAFGEYIDMVVRDEGDSSIVVYAHTHLARTVLHKALVGTSFRDDPLAENIVDYLDTMEGE